MKMFCCSHSSNHHQSSQQLGNGSWTYAHSNNLNGSIIQSNSMLVPQHRTATASPGSLSIF